MSEAEEEVGGESGDAEDELLGEEDFASPPQRKPATRPARSRSPVALIDREAVKHDLGELYVKHDWDDPDLMVLVFRLYPKIFNNRHITGHVGTYGEPQYEEDIRRNHGGGRFRVSVRGRDPRDPGSDRLHILGNRVVEIAGEPGGEIEHLGGAKAIKELQEHMPAGLGAQPKPEAPLYAGYEAALKRRDQEVHDLVEQNKEMRAELFERVRASQKDPEEQSMASASVLGVLKDLASNSAKTQADILSAAERQRKEEFERMALLFQKRGGEGPEIVEGLTKAHQAEISALRERFEAELTVQRGRLESENASLRKSIDQRVKEEQVRAERELDRERSDAKSELDRVRAEAKTEIDRLKGDAKAERQQAERELDIEKREHENDKEGWRRDRDRLEDQHRRELEYERERHKDQTEAMRRDFEMQLRGQSDAKESHSSALKVSYETRIEVLQDVNSRLQAELEALRPKAASADDFVGQAHRMVEVKTAVEGLFGGGGGGGGGDSGGRDRDYEPEPEPKTLMGKLLRFAETPMGERAMEFLGSMAGGAMGMPMPGAYPSPYGPPQMPPGGYPQYPQFQQYQPPQPTAHGTVVDAMPPQPAPVPPRPQPAQRPAPQDVETEEEADFEGFDEEEDAGYEDAVEDEAVEEAEPAPAGPRQPGLGAPAGNARDRVAAAAERLRQRRAQRTERPAPAPAPPQTPEEASPPAAQSPSAPVQITQDQLQQLRLMCAGLEHAITSGQPPDQVATSLMQGLPEAAIRQMAAQPINVSVNELVALVPEAQVLNSQQGRNYMHSVHQLLVAKLAMAGKAGH